MKKRLSLFTVVLCCSTYYSCTTSFVADSDIIEPNAAAIGSSKHGNDITIFDPACLVAPNAKPVKLGEGFTFTEGPAVDKHGNVFFTDQPNDKIYKWSANSGQISLFLTPTGRSNGTYFDKQGNLIACADMYGELWRIAPNGSHTVIANHHNGKKLNGPNDVWINPKNGGIYITDPIFPRGYWAPDDPRQQGWEPTHSEQAETGKGGYVYYLPPGSSTLIRVVTDQMGWDSDSWPNGLVGTPDGKKLYVNRWYYDPLDDKAGTYVFDIKPDGTLSKMKKFTQMGGDGMTIDERGNVYIANGLGVTAFDPKGNKILNIPPPNGWDNVSNVVFGGPNGKTLFMTVSLGPPWDQVASVYGLKMKVKGVVK
jgi:gluconolactonase